MSEHKEYRHAHTGKVGKYSDAVARLFPLLQPVEQVVPVGLEPASEVIDGLPELASTVEDEVAPPRKKTKREVAD